VRIAFLNPIAQIGGAERSLLDILASLRQARPAWDFHLVLGETGPLIDAATRLGVSVHVLPLPKQLARLGDSATGELEGDQSAKLHLLWRLLSATPSAATYVRALRLTLQDLAPDVVHTNGFKMHVLGAWAKPIRVPLIWHIHDYISSRVVMSRALRLQSNGCSAVIANSRSVADDSRIVLGSQIAVHTVWNAVDLDEFSPKGTQLDLDGACGLSPADRGVVRFGLVGTLAKWKGHRIFLRALALLPKDLPIRGYIIGGPLYQTDASQWQLTELKQEVINLELSTKVGFTGYVSRPAEAMRALDVVVHASTAPEPFGLVIAEAMSCGRAVIVSLGGGSVEFAKDGLNTLGHQPGDAASLAARIVELARNHELRRHLGLVGRQTAEQQFDRVRLSEQLIPIYQSVVARTEMRAA
jgi:glycosyltransferase involved in cell wall biosynthesis